MKEINDIKIAFGLSIAYDNKFNKLNLDKLENHKDNIHDIHIAHYDNSIIGSGRFIRYNTKEQVFYIIDSAIERGIRITLLMNYLTHTDYDLIIKDFRDNFYSRGVRSVVIADLELIKRMKQTFPDLYIQGSCLSYRMTEDELYEEAKEGVEIHNPAVDIIRDYKQLIANHNAGFKQKVIFSEGCLHKCPFERVEKGHRWHIARSLLWKSSVDCKSLIKKDCRYFYHANWVTIERLKELSDYIDVIKIPRISNSNIKDIINHKYPTLFYLDLFLNAYKGNNIKYDILDLNGVIYNRFLRKKYTMIPSTYFDKDFFDTVGYCNMQCDKLNCRKCYNIQNRLDLNYKRE